MDYRALMVEEARMAADAMRAQSSIADDLAGMIRPLEGTPMRSGGHLRITRIGLAFVIVSDTGGPGPQSRPQDLSCEARPDRRIVARTGPKDEQEFRDADAAARFVARYVGFRWVQLDRLPELQHVAEQVPAGP